jgi:RNA-binding protein FUS
MNAADFEIPHTDTVYVSGLPGGISERDVEEYFGSIGVIKLDKKTRTKKIWLYRDKVTCVWIDCVP